MLRLTFGAFCRIYLLLHANLLLGSVNNVLIDLNLMFNGC